MRTLVCTALKSRFFTPDRDKNVLGDIWRGEKGGGNKLMDSPANFWSRQIISVQLASKIPL